MRGDAPPGGSEDASGAIPRQDSEHHGRTRTARTARRRARRGPSRPTKRSTGCVGSPSPTSASPGSTTTARSARDCPRPSTARARPPSSARPSWASCWPTADGPVILHPGRRTQVEVVAPTSPVDRTVPGRPPGRPGRGELSTVVWRPAPPRPARTLVVTAGTSDLPVAHECQAMLGALGLAPRAVGRLRGGRRPPAAGVGGRAGRRRRRRRGGRHGRGAGQPRRRASPPRRSWPCPPAPATAPPSRG